MADLHEHDMWQMLFEQTPVVWRWIFGVLTCGIFFLAGVIWKAHKEKVDKAIAEHSKFVRDSDFKFYVREMEKKVDSLDVKFTERLDNYHKHISARLETLDKYIQTLMKHVINGEYEPKRFFKDDERKD